ncbi:MAG: DUF423 domain-containing protein [Bergeyella sp.]|nr:DUF423 domain-containing protein [Bergeyella sp.]
MKTFTLLMGSFYGMTSVLLGAFGAHTLKKTLGTEKLSSFEVGVRYQMYSAFFLLILGLFLKFESNTEKWISILMLTGTLLFSGSIYLLSMQEAWRINLRFLGPATPIGGLMMILSWGFLLYTILSKGVSH